VDTYVLEENETASVFRVSPALISQPKGDKPEEKISIFAGMETLHLVTYKIENM
jgi:hypothetical protein